MKKVFLGASKHIKCDHDKCTQGQPQFFVENSKYVQINKECFLETNPLPRLTYHIPG